MVAQHGVVGHDAVDVEVRVAPERDVGGDARPGGEEHPGADAQVGSGQRARVHQRAGPVPETGLDEHGVEAGADVTRADRQVAARVVSEQHGHEVVGRSEQRHVAARQQVGVGTVHDEATEGQRRQRRR